MASDREKDRTELRKEIKIAIFWRKLIGDMQYVRYNPDDMLRWYLAMDMRGEHEVTQLMEERYRTTSRRTPVLGLVGESPHPPSWLVREWLTTQEPKFPKWRIFGLSCGFVVISGMLFPVIYGCQVLKPMNPLVYKPPATQPNVQQAGTGFQPSIPMASTPITVSPITTYASPAPTVLNGGQSPPVERAQMGVAISAMQPPGTGNTGALNIGASGAQPGAAGRTGPANQGITGAAPPP